MKKTSGHSWLFWPWWVSALLAAAVYSFLTYFAPEIKTTHEGLRNLLIAAPKFAPVLTIPLLLLAATQLYENTPTDKDSNTETDPDSDNQDTPVR